VLTIVIGGNHEASNYFWELWVSFSPPQLTNNDAHIRRYHGGWLAPNIYFLGHAGCVQVNGIRIAGMSGIYKAGDYRLGTFFSFFRHYSGKLADARKGYYERLPYDQRSMRSIYHTRQYNVNRLVHVRPPSFLFSSFLIPPQLTNPDIFLSHDWPQSIEHHGNLKTLLKLRPGFRASVNADTLGSPPLMMLLKRLKPKWWFAGHMHVRFEAEVKHARDAEGTQRGERGKQNQMAGVGKEEIQDDKQTTKFLALDKCLPGRDFLEVPIPTSLPTSPPLLTPFLLLPCR
jgi:lariat debranching enzyme